MRTALVPFLIVPAFLSAAPVFAADASSPVGRWKTIDDKTGQPKSIVEISDEGGKLQGKVAQILDPARAAENPVCVKCEGDQKDKPIVGLRIMWDLKQDGSKWSGGRILDPDNGKTYRCNITVTEGGKKLLVRGFLGMALLGRTQTWLREE